jgi:hypothetical protein
MEHPHRFVHPQAGERAPCVPALRRADAKHALRIPWDPPVSSVPVSAQGRPEELAKRREKGWGDQGQITTYHMG